MASIIGRAIGMLPFSEVLHDCFCYLPKPCDIYMNLYELEIAFHHTILIKDLSSSHIIIRSTRYLFDNVFNGKYAKNP
jgi:hypothetical protein